MEISLSLNPLLAIKEWIRISLPYIKRRTMRETGEGETDYRDTMILIFFWLIWKNLSLTGAMFYCVFDRRTFFNLFPLYILFYPKYMMIHFSQQCSQKNYLIRKYIWSQGTLNQDWSGLFNAQNFQVPTNAHKKTPATVFRRPNIICLS